MTESWSDATESWSEAESWSDVTESWSDVTESWSGVAAMEAALSSTLYLGSTVVAQTIPWCRN